MFPDKIQIKKADLVTIFFTLLTMFFVYSGIYKGNLGRFVPIDLTLGLFLILLLIFMGVTFFRKIECSVPFRDSLAVFCIIISFMLISLFYTISPSYCYKKTILFIFLNIGSFIFAYTFLVAEIITIKKIKMFFTLTTLLMAIFFIIIYFTGHIVYYLYYPDLYRLPDYLAIGNYLVIGIIVNINKNTLLNWIHRFILIFAIIILGARGPFIFLICIFIAYEIIRRDYKRMMITFIILVLFFIIALNTSLGSRMITRLKLIKERGKSITTRIDLGKNAIDIIIEKPVLGIGVGSFGQYVIHKDERLYPHNIFLEVSVENGIFMGLIYLIFFLYLFVYLFFKVNFNEYILLVYLICIYLFLNALKSSNLLDLRIMFFWLGLYVGAIHNENKLRSLIKN